MDACPKRNNTGRDAATRYAQLFWIFMLGSVLGFVLEGIWCILLEGRWESHRATVSGPFCIIYGLGAAVLWLVGTHLTGRGALRQFLVCALCGSFVELLGGVFEKLCFGTTSWDYSAHAGNIGGYVSPAMTMLWGILGIVFVRALVPGLERMLARMEGRRWRFACRVLSVYMACNLLFSCMALERWQKRFEQVPARSAVEYWLDTHYHDEKMEELYPNWRFDAPAQSAAPTAEDASA